MNQKKKTPYRILIPIIIFSVLIGVGYLFYSVYTGIQTSKHENSKKNVQLDKVAFKDFIYQNNVQAIGKKVYSQRCKSCHGLKGEGTLTAPNLTDRYWIQGDGSVESIFKIISQGVLDKGMPSWANTLNQEEIFAITKFVKDLQNSNLGYGKAPQGKKIK